MPALGDLPSPTGAGVGGLGFLLDRVAHSLSRSFAEVLVPAEFSATALGLLTALRRWEPMTQSELASFLGVERQQALHLVNRLADRGLVVRSPHRTDARAWDVRITPAGRQAHDEALVTVREHERATFSVLDEDQPRTLAELLGLLAPTGRYARVLQPPERPTQTTSPSSPVAVGHAGGQPRDVDSRTAARIRR